MCNPKPPKYEPPAQAVPLPAETSQIAKVDNADVIRRKNGRSKLAVPTASTASSATGMSGLNIPS